MKPRMFSEEQGADHDFEFEEEAPTVPCGPPVLAEGHDESPTVRTRALLIEALP